MESEKPSDIYTGPLPSDKRKAPDKRAEPPVKPEPPLPIWVIPALILMGGFVVSGLGNVTGPLLHSNHPTIPVWGKMLMNVVCGLFTLMAFLWASLTVYGWVTDVVEAHNKEKEDYQKQLDKYHQELRDYLEEIDRAARDKVV